MKPAVDVLLVDDDDDLRSLLTRELQHAGHAVAPCADAALP